MGRREGKNLSLPRNDSDSRRGFLRGTDAHQRLMRRPFRSPVLQCSTRNANAGPLMWPRPPASLWAYYANACPARKDDAATLIVYGRRCPCTWPPQTSSHATAGSKSRGAAGGLGRSAEPHAKLRPERPAPPIARFLFQDTWKRAILEKSRRYHIIRAWLSDRRDSSCALRSVSGPVGPAGHSARRLS